MNTTLLKYGSMIACLGMAGCTNLNYPLSTVSTQFAKANFDAQVVDSTPAEGAPQMDAALADAAYQRFLDDDVKKPFDEEAGQAITLQFSPGGGGGGSN